MYSGLPLIAIIEGNIMLFFLLTGDVDILIIHLERTNEITEVLKFKDHLKDLVTEMGYNNISIKLFEEDSKVKVKLQNLLARYKYIFVYISKDYIPATIKRIGLTESSFQYAIKHTEEYSQIKTVCDCEDWNYAAGYPTYLNYYKYKQSIDLEEYKSKLSSLLEKI
jgi:transcriptional regulator of heat shock response